MQEIKLTIDGKEVQLTEEQLKLLGFGVRQNPFNRVVTGGVYYNINDYGEVVSLIENTDYTDQYLYDQVNYFNDEALAQQVALHQLLYRKLLKFAYDNDTEGTLEWDAKNVHYGIFYDCSHKKFILEFAKNYKSDKVYFSSKEVAERALTDVVEPFIKEHPYFVW